MSQQLVIKISGKFTSFNELSEVPEGALLEATNIDILQDSIAQPRRGFDKEPGEYSDNTDATDALFEYPGTGVVLSHHGTYGSANKLSYLNSGTWTDLETVSAISGRKMKFTASNQNVYYTTATGIRAIEAYNGTPRAAGAYKALDMQTSQSASLSTWLAASNSVAYRGVWVKKDANDNYIYGSPSQREVFTNSTGGAVAVDIAVTIPTGVTTAWVFQLYRSAMINGTPNDELGQVYEYNPSSGDISSKSFTITDIVPDSLRGATIYTASSQQGLAASNEAPPLAEDIDIFRECVFFANTKSKQRLNLTLVSVGSPNGIVANDTVTIGGTVYTAKASETIASGEFKVTTSGSAASNIDLTARSLVRVINRYSSSTVYAYYLSGPTDLPGQILLEERSLGGNSFAITSSRATCWSPSNIPTSGTAVSSTNDTFTNGLFWSKENLPEAVPLTNFVQVGAKNDNIVRIRALRDALYIFKDSGKIYKLTGYYPNFQVDKIEDSVKLIGRETLQILNNQLYGLSDQGVFVLADSTKIISRPIEQEILTTLNQVYDTVNSVAFGISYESDRKYYLFMPSTSSEYPLMAHVYNVFTNTWTEHDLSASCALVTQKNEFYLGSPTVNYLLKERKNYSLLDYADYGFETSITDVTGNVITLDSGTDNISVGDLLYKTGTLFATILSINTVASQVTIDADPGFAIDTISILHSINTRLTWVPFTASNPGVQKQFDTVMPIFKSDFTGTSTLGFYTDLDTGEETVAITGRGIGLWGLFPWGTIAWGGTTYKRPARQWVPRKKQRASQLTVSWSHSYGFSSWQLTGISLTLTMGSDDVNRS